MKKRLVQTIAQGDNTFGQVSHPDDLMKAQDFSHSRIGDAVHDFVNNHKTAEITGFTYQLGAGNAFNIQIKKPGRIWTKDGVSFDLLNDVTLAFEPADEDNPRLDVVVAVLEDNVAAEATQIPFVRLRTTEEFSDSVPPYPPQNINAPREKHWRAVPQIKSGTPASDAPGPGVSTNEIPLYLVAIAPGATQIRDADVLDLREVALTLRKLNELTSDGRVNLSNLTGRVNQLEKLIDQPIDLSQVFGEIRTLGDILSDLQRQIIAARDVPEIRYDRPKVPLTNINSSKIVATGGVAGLGLVPHVDIEVGGRVNFGDAEVALLPHNFPEDANARFQTVGVNAGNLRRELDLTLEDVQQTAGDGFVDFVQRTSEFAAARGRMAAAARNEQFIEVFGGLAADNSSTLGDWLTYDILNDTLTERVPLLALPSSERAALFPYGDGTNVLLIAGAGATPQCFRLNAISGAVTQITSTKPTGIQFFGDLIAPGKIFIVAIRQVGAEFETDYWEFSTATNTFTELGVTGSVPSLEPDTAGGCYYSQNQFVMVRFDPRTRSSGETYLFDRTDLQWVKQNIPQPYRGTSAEQLPITRFRLANVNGRPLLVGGLLAQDTDPTHAKVWELSPPIAENGRAYVLWQPSDATFPPLQSPGFCSTLAGNGLPTAKAFMFAGQGRYNTALRRVYSSVQGGLIAVSYNGENGVSIADTSSFVQFEIDSFVAAWEVEAYWAGIRGLYNTTDIRVEVSMNNGAKWYQVSPHGRSLEIDTSSDPAVRRLRITLYRNLSQMPILTHLTEILDADGTELEDRVVLRYDAPDSVKALYVDRKGLITLESEITPSTPEKCLIHKITPTGGVGGAPSVKNYINRRRAHFKKSGANYNPAPDIDIFDNELAVPVRYVNAFGIRDSGADIYKITDPPLPFDQGIELLPGLLPGDDWMVEIEG